jgi:hypothetical protein
MMGNEDRQAAEGCGCERCEAPRTGAPAKSAGAAGHTPEDVAAVAAENARRRNTPPGPGWEAVVAVMADLMRQAEARRDYGAAFELRGSWEEPGRYRIRRRTGNPQDRPYWHGHAWNYDPCYFGQDAVSSQLRTLFLAFPGGLSLHVFPEAVPEAELRAPRPQTVVHPETAAEAERLLETPYVPTRERPDADQVRAETQETVWTGEGAAARVTPRGV